MIVNEIFGSIDGEGLRTGELATFIRLAGCNVRCSYCDTEYALKINQGTKMTVNQILEKVKKIGYKNITLTGGEPLIHKDVAVLINKLAVEGYNVNIETNGTQDIDLYTDYQNVFITMDYKTISSGVNNKMNVSRLETLRECDVLKFVIGSEEDIKDIKQLLQTANIKSYIYFSPVFEKVQPSRLVDFLKELHDTGIRTDKTRVQVQLHKIIWKPNKRGV